MEIKLDMRYNMRGGGVTGEIQRNEDAPRGNYLWKDPATDDVYTKDGSYWDDGTEDSCDLISEYIEPKDTAPDDYRRGLQDAVLWLVKNSGEFKPEYLAHYMAGDLIDDR